MEKHEKLQLGRYEYGALLTFISYAAGSVAVPVVLVSLAKDLNFPLADGGMTAGGFLHFGRSVAMVAALVLCGFAAARFGLRRTLGFSVVLMGIGVGLCAVAPWYGILLAALLIAGIGEGVIEGLATPFVQDLHPKDPGRYLNFTHGFWSLGVFTVVLLAGWMISAGISWRWVLALVAISSIIPGWIILGKENPDHPYPEAENPPSPQKVFSHAGEIMKRSHFWLFFFTMIVAGGGEFCLTFWCASFIQLNFAASALAGGIGTASYAAGMFLGRTGWGILIKQRQLRALVLYSAIAATLLSLPIPLLSADMFENPMTVLYVLNVLLFFSGIASGPFWPSLQSYCADRLRGVDTTMLFILLSCAGVPGCGFFAYLMGIVGDYWGLRISFYLIPFCFGMLVLLLLAETMIYGKRKEIKA